MGPGALPERRGTEKLAKAARMARGCGVLVAMRDDERRRFPRLLVPVLYRSARLLSSRTEARDLSMGGIRVLTDSALPRGQRLEIELFLPSGDSFSVDVSVAWVSPADADSGAKFEAGLSFFALDARKAALLRQCVARGESGAPPA